MVETFRKKLPESFLKSSPATSLMPITHYEVGLESTASLIAQKQLNDARKDFLSSASLPATHEVRKRANELDGTLLPIQPDGTPRKVYEPHKIPRPRVRKDKEAARYFLERNRLVRMWNGKWTKDSDWEAWDKVKAKMERQFSNYRLVEQPSALNGWQANEYWRREKKRKRDKENAEAEAETRRMKRCSAAEDNEEQIERLATPLPTPKEVLAAVPLEGIRMELLLAKFWKPEGLDTERFCTMLYEIGHVNKYTKMFTVGKGLDAGENRPETWGGGHEGGEIPIDPVLLNASSGNRCMKDPRLVAF